MLGFAGPHYYGPWWREEESPGATAYINAHFEFHAGGGGDFLCDMLQDFADAFNLIAPEFAVGEIELGEAIQVTCTYAVNDDF